MTPTQMSTSHSCVLALGEKKTRLAGHHSNQANEAEAAAIPYHSAYLMVTT